ncbi:MAG: hypothetical protein HUK08_00410 [Bacteroidaceae bacterium]|nr:hypothetical protein [Bacteroidaceae bacterium]
MATKITEKPVVTQMTDDDAMLMVVGNATKRMTVKDFRTHLNDNDNQVLNDLAFYIDINKRASDGNVKHVDVGGNAHMRQMWEDSWKDILLQKDGNCCLLNPNDCRYTSEGEAVVDMTTNEILSKWAHCDMMTVIPLTYGHIQEVSVGANTIQRLWLSLIPLPNGFVIPQQVVGKFTGYGSASGGYRSLPNKVPTTSQTINTFWNWAQVRGKNFGLANADFRDILLFYMMSKYAQRSCQEATLSDGTLIWGVGLDGTESKGADRFNDQKSITTGKTLSLGNADGKVATTDANGDTVHCVSVHGFENPWGQYWEMVQGLCSIANSTDTYRWRGNVLPTGTPTASSFTNIDHIILQRASSTISSVGINIIADATGQGAYMLPKESNANTNYGDFYYCSSLGLLWLWGGTSNNGSACGLACSNSNNAWSNTNSNIAARHTLRKD